MNKKLCICIALFFFAAVPFFSQSLDLPAADGYRINDVNYEIDGITKSSAMERNVRVDTRLVFESEEALVEYLNGIVRSIDNLRLLENVAYSVSEDSVSDGNVLFVNVLFTGKDSKHMVVLPKPGYNSNSGFELKLKLKDTNFLGFMNTLNSELSMAYGNSSDPSNPKFSLGVGADFDLPFKTGILLNTWSNAVDVSYTFGDNSPEFSYTTGLNVGLPLGIHMLNFYAGQTVARDLDYNSFGDTLYFNENFNINAPITLFRLNNIVPLVYTPYVSYSFNWDPDGINPANTSLYKPVLSVGETFSFNNVNWEGNLRDGISTSTTQKVSFVFDPSKNEDVKIVPYFDLNATYFMNWGWGGLNTRFYGFWEKNGSTCIGSYLRGTLDSNAYTSSALCLQIGMPFHLFTTGFMDLGLKKYGSYENFNWFAKFMSYCDFEMQASPFVDVALVKNGSTGVYFNPRDGFYDAGIEILVYPARWKSFVVRGSFGVDIGRKLLKDVINMDGRENGRSWELYIGLGNCF